MSKFLCRCSHVISLVSSPTSDEFTLVSNKLLYDLAEQADKGRVPFDEFFDRIEATGKDVIICPVCARIWIKKDEGPEYWPYLEEKE
ncbi:hypothetical protein QF008_005059 [Pseudomonas protegens]|uniref:Uncharacterized protein n=1 Tax=Pseudomonas protegens TaxID=380021 RepID=A0ABY2VA81_9PSED|nr:hypothetical protein [Pseudomonas protegens]GED79523.1 hypothetical protein PFL02_63730 [Pseudomonas fluorescens]MBP5100575.1 hypothetical protein [Pseudomonas protegens]MBP5120593.1 hypothetical protein [Pseudomonas protegens]MBP5123718.1 hypothetical protein [Pseudomonas protegens]MDT3423291.1 hypothetical protein [Pseudomonas protegens]